MRSPVPITRKLPNPEGVSAGGTAQFRIPVGRRIHELHLVYNYNASTQNVADFTEIRIYLNGSVFQRFTGTERDTLNQFEGRAASTGILTIPFVRKGLKQSASELETALNTGVSNTNEAGLSISSMYMEIDLDAGMTIAATDLSLYSVEDDAVPGGPGLIPYIRREQRTAAGADSDFQISDLINPGVNAPDKISLNRVTFVPSTGSISELQIDRNGYTIFERTDALNRAIQNDHARTAQSGYYSIDTTEKGYGGIPIELYNMNDFRYRLNLSAGMTITALSEYFGVLTA